MHEKSSLQFLRTATGIQSVLDALEKPRAVMNFYTILWVTGLSWSFIIVVKEKAIRELTVPLRLEFSKNIFGNLKWKITPPEYKIDEKFI